MFNDERERLLLDPQQHEQSIQAWAQQMRDAARQDRRSIGMRVLLTVGKGFIRIGSTLSKRFGSDADLPHRPLARRNPIYN